MLRSFLFFILFSVFTRSIAQDTVLIKDLSSQLNTDTKESYFFSERELSITDIEHQQFKPKKDVQLYYITGILWVKFIIKNNTTNQRFVLHASDGHLSGMYLYKPTPYGYVKTPPRTHHPEDGREIKNRIPAFFIDLQPQETKTFYLKVYSENEVANFNYFIEDYASYVESVQIDYLILGLYAGALILIITVNLFYFISLKDTLFLIYAIYVLITLLVTLTIHGFVWLWIPDTETSYHIAFFIFRSWPDILIFFTIRMVSFKQYYPKITKFCYGFIAYHTLIMPFFEFSNIANIRAHWEGQWETLNMTFGLFLVFIIIVLSFKHNKYLLKYYIIAYGVMLLTMAYFTINTLKKSNWVVVEHILKIGTLVEIITFSFAVSRSFKITQADLKKKKEEERRLHEKVKQLEMDVRKAQMNPHFMFNALTSIDYFILKNDTTQARHYLSKFSKLMRLTLDNSKSNFVPLHDELNALTFYIELEFLRLKSSWHTFEIKTNEKVDLEMLVPPLLLQPFVENAIWHGLQKKKEPGKLLVEIDFYDGELKCTVEDDGLGIKRELIPEQTTHKASGISITKERLTLIHNILKTTSEFSIKDRRIENTNMTGTKVQFNIPYIQE